MDDHERRRARQVVLTGALAPGLALGVAGAVGFDGATALFGPASAAAQSSLSEASCSAFGAPQTAAGELSVADVAAKVNPAVVTILNMQQMAAGEIGELPGFPGFPELPGISDLPGIEGIPGDHLPSAAQDQDQEDDQSQPDENQSEDNDDEGASEAVDTILPLGSGSGFIVDEAGHVITNAHVVAGAEELTVILSDGTEVPATVVGSDPLLDIAVLELYLPAGTSVPGTVTFGDSSTLRAGDEVVAIGNAFGEFPNTVSKGTVNGLHRSFPGVFALSAMIQHDAGIWSGSSGGPLLDLHGDVVGINTAGLGAGLMGIDIGSDSMGFAVDGNIACNAAADLIAEGKIVWPYLGIQAETGDDGQTVVEVVPDGPAADAGLEEGDVITAFAGQELDRQHMLFDLLFAHEPGDSVDVTVDRDGDTQTFPITLGERPADLEE